MSSALSQSKEPPFAWIYRESKRTSTGSTSFEKHPVGSIFGRVAGSRAVLCEPTISEKDRPLESAFGSACLCSCQEYLPLKVHFGQFG